MAKVLCVAGWIVAVGAVAAALYLYGVNRELNARLEYSFQEREEILRRVELLVEHGRTLEGTVEGLSKELVEAQRVVNALADRADRAEQLEQEGPPSP